MNILQSILIFFVAPILTFLQIVLIVYMIMSWFTAFNIVNLRNPLMGQIYQICRQIVEPMLRPFRRFIPPLGGLDMAFFVVFLGLIWLRDYILPSVVNMLG